MIISNEVTLKMYEIMKKFRFSEELASEMFKKGEIPGWLHSYSGQEAVAAGICFLLNKEDYITSTHRGHGHCIAKGVDLNRLWAELYGKENGYCKGKGGSMHICDAELGILGANGIVGGGIPIATGAAFACKYLNSGQIVVCFFSDGATNQGCFHESLNIASLWKLPIIYVCENNGYGIATAIENSTAVKNIADKALAYNMKSLIIDGMDCIEVYTKMKSIIDFVRNNRVPVLVEAKTFKFAGHYVGDPMKYLKKGELESWKKKDPIIIIRKHVLNNKIVGEDILDEIDKKVEKKVIEARDFARNDKFPDENTLLEYVWS